MNWHAIEGDWPLYRLDAQKQFAKLSDAQLDASHGNRERLCADIQTAYSLTKEDADKQVTAWSTAQKPTLHAF